MRWTVGKILYATMLLCMLFGIVRLFFGLEEHLLIALNFALLTLASIGAYYSQNWRRYFLGYAVFNWMYVIVAINSSFAEVLLGWLMGLLCALATKLIPN